MLPIQDVLHRIQWDPAWRGGRFDIGYLDRVVGAIVRVPFEALQSGEGSRAALMVRDDDVTVRRIPLHRVRQVWKDGVVIWERPAGRAQA
jgi:uncharacterized protein (UPF0248 family)